MLLLEEKIQKMEQKNLGEMVFAAERLTKKRLKGGRKEVKEFSVKSDIK